MTSLYNERSGTPAPSHRFPLRFPRRISRQSCGAISTYSRAFPLDANAKERQVSKKVRSFTRLPGHARRPRCSAFISRPRPLCAGCTCASALDCSSDCFPRGAPAARRRKRQQTRQTKTHRATNRESKACTGMAWAADLGDDGNGLLLDKFKESFPIALDCFRFTTPGSWSLLAPACPGPEVRIGAYP